MAISPVGTPGNTHSTTGSVTGTWGTGQVRTAGDLLVAIVSCAASTSVTATATVSGWTNRIEQPNSGTANVRVACWTKTAAGADAAPTFTSTETGTAGGMDCMLFELAGANTTTVIDTSGVYASGASSGTLATMTATTAAVVASYAEYAISAFAQEAAAASLTWTGNAAGGFSALLGGNGVSTVLQTYIGAAGNPLANSLLNDAGAFSVNTSAFGAGLVVAFAATTAGSPARDAFANNAAATVTAGGTTAPAAGTVESWTVNVTGAFPAASPLIQFTVCDPALPAEKFLVTTAPGGAGSAQSWTVTRGAEGSTPAAHTANFSIVDVVTAGTLSGYQQVFNVKSPRYGAVGNGVTDDNVALQAALTAAGISGGVVYCPPGVYITGQLLQIGSNTTLCGDGMGISTIRMKNASSPTQVGTLTGISVLVTTLGGTPSSNVVVRDLTIDGNELGNPSSGFPGWTGASVQCDAIALYNIDKLRIENVEVINAIAYSIMLTGCTHFAVNKCRILSGQVTFSSFNQQDGIHVTGCQYGILADNHIDTGTINGVGDDGIAIQSLSAGAPCTDITVSANVIRAAARGISLVLGGGAVSGIDVTGNDVYTAQHEGLIFNYGAASSGIVQNVSVIGNTFSNIALSGSGSGITLQGVNDGIGSGSGAGYNDVIIESNTFVSMVSTGGFGIFAGQGGNLQVNDNVFDAYNCYTAIQVGNNNAGTSAPVNNFQISCNTINAAASSHLPSIGITVMDAHDGVISGNTMNGPNTTGSIGIQLQGVSATNLVTGVVINGNRLTGWLTALQETNSGGIPDYNVFTDNIMHGCATAATLLGPHDVTQVPVNDVGGVTDTEQFTCLSAAYTLANSTSAQKLFNATANGALTVVPGLFFFECEFDITGLSGSAHTLSFGFGGTATYTSLKYVADRIDTSTALSTAGAWTKQVITSASATAVTAAGVTTTIFAARMSGALRVSAGGTLIPQITQGTASAAAAVGANSWIRLVPVGLGATTSYGNWS